MGVDMFAIGGVSGTRKNYWGHNENGAPGAHQEIADFDVMRRQKNALARFESGDNQVGAASLIGEVLG